MSDLADLTISDYVVAAMCGNFAVESTVNPGVWESLIPCAWDYQYEYTNRGGYGLGQWTNVGTPYGRNYQRHVWMSAQGYADDDGYGQLDYILHENYWTPNYGSISTLEDFLTSTLTDLGELTMMWLRNWEGIGTGTYQQRLNYANTFYSYIQAHLNDDPATYTWIASNSYLSVSDMCNNVMCMFFGIGGKLKRLKIWLLWQMSKNSRIRGV